MLVLPATTVVPSLQPPLKLDHKLFCVQQGGPVLAVMHITVLLPPARIQSIQPPPMPDGQTPMPNVKSLDTPRGGSVLMFTVACVTSSLLSSSALPAPMLPLCLPVLPGPQCISAVAPCLRRPLPMPDELLCLLPDDRVLCQPRGGPLPMPMVAHPLFLLLLPTSPAPIPATLPLPQVPKTAAMLTPQSLPLPDVATLPMPVVLTGAPDSTLGTILDAIASICTSFRCHVRWMPRVFQVF